MTRSNTTLESSGDANGSGAILLRRIDQPGPATIGKRVVNLVELLDETCAGLLSTVDCAGSLTRLPSDDCAVTSDEAAVIGLIVSEAVTNAIKYAHPTGVPGKITLECKQDHKGGITIDVTDDGVGLPENFDPTSDGSVGFRMMRALSERLEAALAFESSSLGLCVSLRVPDKFKRLALLVPSDTPDGDGDLYASSNASARKVFTQDQRATKAPSGHLELLEALPVAVYMTDAEGSITFYNEAAATLWGCRPELGKAEFCGSWKLYWPDGTPLPHDECPMAIALKQKKAVRGLEAVAERPDGTRIPFVPFPTPLFDGSGAVVGAINMLVDISERKRAEVALARHRDEQAALYQLTDNLFRASSLTGVCDAALDAIRRALGCERASILLYDESGLMRFLAWRGLSDDYRRAVEGHSPWTRNVKAPQPICVPDVETADLAKDLKSTVMAEGIGALAFIPLVVNGELVGKFMTYYAAPHAFTDAEMALAITIARQLGFSMERMRAEKALRQSQEQLLSELSATQTLQKISTQLIQENDPEALYEQILDAAAVIMGSDLASMQIVDESQDALRMLVWRGFDAQFGKVFELNRPDTRTSCSVARSVGHRVVVPDVEACDFIVDTPALDDHRKMGIRAVQSTPLVSRTGSMLGMISTHWRHPHQPSERELSLLDVLARQAADLIERKQTEQTAQRLVAIIDSSHDAVVSKDLNGIITTWNRGAERLFGYTVEEAIGRPITTLIPPDRHNEEHEILERIRRGERVDPYETVRQRKDGSLIDISLSVSPVKDAAGKVVGASKIARDISDQKQVQARQELLTREIQHRTKNLFAVVLAVVSRSFVGKYTVKDAEASVVSRLRSLGQTHVMLLDKEWQGADLAEVVRAEMSPYAGRVQVEGPSIMLSARAAQNFALALHELATNAAKYGALSNATGRVHISWSKRMSNGSNLFTFRWQEQGGPPVWPPTQRGFGSAVLEQVMAEYFEVPPRIDFPIAGVSYELIGPLDALSEQHTADGGVASARA